MVLRVRVRVRVRVLLVRVRAMQPESLKLAAPDAVDVMAGGRAGERRPGAGARRAVDAHAHHRGRRGGDRRVRAGHGGRSRWAAVVRG